MGWKMAIAILQVMAGILLRMTAGESPTHLSNDESMVLNALCDEDWDSLKQYFDP